MLTISKTWKETYPGAAVGILALHNVANPKRHPELEARKAALEERLRAQFTGQAKAGLKALPIIQAYTAYYKRFKKEIYTAG